MGSRRKPRKRGAIKRRGMVWAIFATPRTFANLWNGRLGEGRWIDAGPRRKVTRKAARRG